MSAVLSPARLPERHDSIGPITARRLRRTGFAYLALCTLGFALALAASTPGWQAFGLGLAFPGGGFLHFLAGGPWSVLLHLGCALLILGVFMMLYVRDRRLWVWLQPETPDPAAPGTTRTRITTALSSTRRTLDGDREFERLKKALLKESAA